jgi:hypothetical protein
MGTNDTAAFALGFVLGQTNAYVEQVKTGAKLAAQIGCSKAHLPDVIAAVTEEKCEVLVEDREYDRVAVWMFRLPFVRTLIEQMSQKTTPPTAGGVWAMGKLFGYSDSEIGAYLQVHELVKSASDSESSPRPFEGKSGWRKEQKYLPG